MTKNKLIGLEYQSRPISRPKRDTPIESSVKSFCASRICSKLTKTLGLVSLALAFMGVSMIADALASIGSLKSDLESEIKIELSKNFSNASIDLSGPIQWVRGSRPKQFTQVMLFGDDGRGHAHFLVRSESKPNTSASASSEGWVGFSAWLPAMVATQRIRPNQEINPQWFSEKRINVGYGEGRQYLGLLLEPQKLMRAENSVAMESFSEAHDQPLQRFEATQSILEGHYLLSSSVRPLPDVRRGDRLKIQMISNQVSVSIQGTAEEVGYLDKSVRAMTLKTKRQVMGRLRPNGVLEVIL